MQSLCFLRRSLSLPKLVILITLIFFTDAFSQEKFEGQPKVNIQNVFAATGWMGDGEYGRKYVEFDGAYETKPRNDDSNCIRIKYTFGPRRWAGIYWQNKSDNWGDQQGNNYSKRGFKKVTFWARGETGKENVEFKAGGINNPTKKYHDSFEETIGRVTLSTEWKLYTIDLGSADLSSVIGGFCWVASADYNNREIVIFYIDDIYLK